PRCRPNSTAPATRPTWMPRSMPAARRGRPPPTAIPTAPGICPTCASCYGPRWGGPGGGGGARPADLDSAVDAGREAVATPPDGHPDRAGYLSNLCVALQTRFVRAG